MPRLKPEIVKTTTPCGVPVPEESSVWYGAERLLKGGMAEPKSDSERNELVIGMVVKAKFPEVAPELKVTTGNPWNNTPFTVVSGTPFGPTLKAATSVPSVFTSLSPEILLADPQVMGAAADDVTSAAMAVVERRKRSREEVRDIRNISVQL